jgi:hypothetical protein
VVGFAEGGLAMAFLRLIGFSLHGDASDKHTEAVHQRTEVRYFGGWIGALSGAASFATDESFTSAEGRRGTVYSAGSWLP